MWKLTAVVVLLWCWPYAAAGVVDGRDLDMLSEAIVNGSKDPKFDMNDDGVVNLEDITDPDSGWLNAGGSHYPTKTAGRAFLPGDANLDGRVDGADFLIWNANKLRRTSRWTQGDFNADGVVDGLDFSIWNDNKFLSSKTAPPT
jgi:hypothetical protein